MVAGIVIAVIILVAVALLIETTHSPVGVIVIHVIVLVAVVLLVLLISGSESGIQIRGTRSNTATNMITAITILATIEAENQ